MKESMSTISPLAERLDLAEYLERFSSFLARPKEAAMEGDIHQHHRFIKALGSVEIPEPPELPEMADRLARLRKQGVLHLEELYDFVRMIRTFNRLKALGLPEPAGSWIAGIEVPDEVREVLLKHHPKMARFKDVPADEIAISTRIMTKKGCERIAKAAFEYARKTGRKSVTVVEKPNVLRETGGLMLKVTRSLKEKYPEIEYMEANVDAMAMWLVKNPERYDVLVAENLFGDIISDLAAQLVGGLGFASAGNIGDNYAVFEPTHGSAPKYAGQYKVNPMAMLLATRMMLEWLGEKEMADNLERAIAEVIKEGKVRTYDMGGDASTLDVARAVAERL